MTQRGFKFVRIVILSFFLSTLMVQNSDAGWNFAFDPITENRASSGKPFPKVMVFGSKGSFVMKDNATISVSVTNPWIEFKCIAPYPIIWVFDNIPSITDNTRKWDINNVRRVTQLENNATYIFESTLLFTYRPPLEPRQQTCRSTVKTDEVLSLQTKIKTSYEGQYIRMSGSSFEAPRIILNSRYGSNPNCSISMIDDPEAGKICCYSENTSFFTRGCSDYPSCKGFFTKKNCENFRHPEDMDDSNTQCMNYTELIAGGSSGVVVCKANGMPDSNSATFNYFPSVPNLCKGNSTAIAPRLFVDRDAPIIYPYLSDMLRLCEPDSKDLYVGENVNFTCLGSFYYFSSGLRWIIKRKDSHDELLEAQEEDLRFSNFPSENNIIKSVRSLQKWIFMNETKIYEIQCLAPIWNSFNWVNKSITVNVKEPTKIAFHNGPLLENIIYESDAIVNCSASGDPMPEVKWENIPPDLNDTLKQNQSLGWSALQFPKDLSTLPGVFKLTCTAEQPRIHRKQSKTFQFLKPTESNSTVYYLFLLFLLLPIIIYVFYIIKTMPIRNELSPIEIEEFLYGRFGVDLRQIPDVNTRAMLMPYDRRFELKSKHLKIGEVITNGAFGIIKKGTYKNLMVALKTCKPFADILFFKALLSELKLMIHLGKHKNIVNLIGARTKYIYRREVYIVTEYCENGNLLEFLQKHRVHFYNDIHRFTNSSLTPNASKSYVSFDAVHQSPYYLLKSAKEIAEGMEFLSSKKVIHGDLAARNILLTGNLTAKLSDFGLSHQLANYYVYIPNCQMPVPAKWLAPECLLDLELTVWSDVWAYGVTLWEIFTLGDKPWEQFEDRDIRGIYAAILEGERVAKTKPPLATPAIYDKMLQCWEKDRERRCSFEDLVAFFKDEMERVALTVDTSFLPDNEEELCDQVLHI